MFTCKASYSLLGKKVAEFSNDCKCFDVCLVEDYSQGGFFNDDEVVIFCSFNFLGSSVSREPEYKSFSKSKVCKNPRMPLTYFTDLFLYSLVFLGVVEWGQCHQEALSRYHEAHSCGRETCNTDPVSEMRSLVISLCGYRTGLWKSFDHENKTFPKMLSSVPRMQDDLGDVSCDSECLLLNILAEDTIS